MSKLRIGTWNVEYARSTLANARRRAVMRRYPADIWVLTETHDALKPCGSFRAVHSAQRKYHGKLVGRIRLASRWVSIWTRFPNVRRLHIPRTDHSRTVIAHVATPIGPLIVYGTVMPWRGDTERKIDAAVENQVRDWRYLRGRHRRVPLCIAGDFNTTMVSGADYLTKKAFETMRDAMRDERMFCATGPDLLSASALSGRPIDHIVLPSAWLPRTKVAAAWEGKVGSPRLSDHSGLIVEIRA